MNKQEQKIIAAIEAVTGALDWARPEAVSETHLTFFGGDGSTSHHWLREAPLTKEQTEQVKAERAKPRTWLRHYRYEINKGSRKAHYTLTRKGVRVVTHRVV